MDLACLHVGGVGMIQIAVSCPKTTKGYYGAFGSARYDKAGRQQTWSTGSRRVVSQATPRRCVRSSPKARWPWAPSRNEAVWAGMWVVERIVLSFWQSVLSPESRRGSAAAVQKQILLLEANIDI